MNESPTDDRPGLMRLLDANLNRAREALRVVEDAFRFINDDAIAQGRLKRMRHSLARYESLIDPGGTLLLENRASADDVGAFVNPASEMSRAGLQSVIRANMRRSEEALRCLEEYGKLFDAQAAGIAKRLRFDAYEFEKEYGLAIRDDESDGIPEGEEEE